MHTGIPHAQGRLTVDEYIGRASHGRPCDIVRAAQIAMSVGKIVGEVCFVAGGRHDADLFRG